MARLQGTLGQRQKQLNMIVKEAAIRHNSFEDIQSMMEMTDIERLIKIDLASKFQNLDYLIEVLKGGDSLYITRVLKCSWIYDVKHSAKLNAKFVEENIFPFMSVKMRRKMLTFMSMNIKDAERIAEFVKCCMDIQSPKLAFKFVVHASEATKIKFLTENTDIIERILSNTYLQHFIGDSFALAEELLKLIKIEPNKLKVLYNIRHLYSLNNLNYLDLVEKYVPFTPFTNFKRLGALITKNLIEKHKERVINNARIYINFLHAKTVVDCISPDEAKIIVTALHPETVGQYWNECFCLFYESIINKIPYADRYQHLKSTFFSKYKSEIFENSYEFCNKHCYKFMTEEEKLEWIQDQITKHPEMKHYSLYNILAFDTAFEKITDLVKSCDSSETRLDIMLFILPTVKNQLHIKRLLDYYRDSKDPELVQQDFINRLLRDHEAYYFNEDCWTILNEIFIKLKVYDFSSGFNTILQNFRTITILYYIINENNLSEELKTYISETEYLNPLLTLSRKTHLADQQKVYRYFFDFYLEKISEFDSKQEVSELLKKYVTGMLDLMSFYGKTKDDIPDVVMSVVESCSDLQTHKLIHVLSYKVTQKEIMKLLKVDPKMVVDKLPSLIKTQEISPTFRVSQLFKKLKVYFSNDTEDISYQCFEFYQNWLLKNSLSKTCTEAAIYAIFLLGDDAFKVHFMTTNVPIDDEKSKIDRKKLRIQHAICATVFQSRPPVPIKHVIMYIKGQYIRSCLHLINSYLVNLPLPLCMEFLTEMMQMRSLAQEHSIHVAFTCFTSEQLRRVILHIWNKNKNPSVRLMLYKTLYDRVCKEKKTIAQTALFDNLLALTAGLDENDVKDIFTIVVSGGIPEQLVSAFANTAWIAINSLPKDNINLYRRADVIDYMLKYFYLMEQKHVRAVIEDFIEDLFDNKEINKSTQIDDAIFNLYNKKLELTGKFLTCASNDEDLFTKKEIAGIITRECMTRFSFSEENKYDYVGRDVLIRFIKFMQKQSYTHHCVFIKFTNKIFEKIIELLSAEVPNEQIYFIIWDMHVDMAVRKAMINIYLHYTQVISFTEKLSTLREILLSFGNYIGNVINTYLEGNKYLKNLTAIIVNKSFPHVNRIVNATKDVDIDDVLVVIGLALLRFKTPEHYMIALILVPDNYTGLYYADYKKILSEMMICTYKDVTALTFQKFINSDCKKKDTFKLLTLFRPKDVQLS